MQVLFKFHITKIGGISCTRIQLVWIIWGIFIDADVRRIRDRVAAFIARLTVVGTSYALTTSFFIIFILFFHVVVVAVFAASSGLADVVVVGVGVARCWYSSSSRRSLYGHVLVFVLVGIRHHEVFAEVGRRLLPVERRVEELCRIERVLVVEHRLHFVCENEKGEIRYQFHVYRDYRAWDNESNDLQRRRGHECRRRHRRCSPCPLRRCRWCPDRPPGYCGPYRRRNGIRRFPLVPSVKFHCLRRHRLHRRRLPRCRRSHLQPGEGANVVFKSRIRDPLGVGELGEGRV